jgi:membrane protease YdiL (CAAX protease family)
VFGIMHAYQDVGGAARAAILGAVLAVPVVLTGSIVPAMVAHAAIDLTSGLLLARWLLR